MSVSSSFGSSPAPWNRLWDQGRAWWRRVPAPVRRRQATALGVGVALATAAGFWAFTPRWAPLYTGLSPSAAGAMTGVLQQAKISYRLTAGGSTILVQAAEVDQARVDLAQHNLPASPGAASLPTSSILSLGQTPAQTAAAEQAALDATLDQTLTGITGVSRAQVLITEPPTALFGETTAPASASVFLQLTPGTVLSAAQVGAVQHLVASAVNGLTPDHVAVVNQQGQLLSSQPAPVPAGLSGGQWHTVEALNAYYEGRLTSLLDQIFGPGAAVVRVASSVNWQASSTQSTTTTPNGLGAQQTSSSTGTNPAGTAAGTATNVPTYPAGATGGGTTSSRSSIQRFVTKTTHTNSTTSAGQLTHLTVAVAVDKQLSAVTRANVIALVRQAVGATKQDTVTLVGLPFNTSAATAAEVAMTKAAARQQELHYAQDLLLVLLAGGALLWIRRQLRVKAGDTTMSLPASPSAGPLSADGPADVVVPRWYHENPEGLAKVIRTMVEGGDLDGGGPSH